MYDHELTVIVVSVVLLAVVITFVICQDFIGDAASVLIENALN